LEDKALDATAGALELHGHTAVWQALEALFRNGWASQISAEPFQCLWLVGRDCGGRMQGESVLLSAERVRPPRPNRWPCGLADGGGALLPAAEEYRVVRLQPPTAADDKGTGAPSDICQDRLNLPGRGWGMMLKGDVQGLGKLAEHAIGEQEVDVKPRPQPV
jgi:hypothetical protein